LKYDQCREQTGSTIESAEEWQAEKELKKFCLKKQSAIQKEEKSRRIPQH
jgi:hypothetical protein